MFSNIGNSGNCYSSFQLRISNDLIAVGTVPSFAILYMKQVGNSKICYLPLCNKIQSLGSTGSWVADSQSIKCISSTSLRS